MNYYTILHKDPDFINFLLEQGAHLFQKNNDGKIPEEVKESIDQLHVMACIKINIFQKK